MNREPKLIGKSPHIQRLRQFIKRAAKSDASVLLLGETGVGKEIAAHLIHVFSDRKDGPFIKVNCANFIENLFEGELFGYKKGAFTGAFIDKHGLIEEANGGTLISSNWLVTGSSERICTTGLTFYRFISLLFVKGKRIFPF